jgi:NADPH:quinone reductase-like Zn-dependent oxidoreductase
VVGSSVTDFAPGDEVLAALFAADDLTSARARAFQEYAAVPSIQVAKKPAHISFAEAASLPVGFLTAATSLSLGLRMTMPFVDRGDDEGYRPKSVLILGGSFMVGAATIQTLRLISSDCLILATSSPKNHET